MRGAGPVVGLLALALTPLAAGGPAAAGPGRLLSASGVAFGGIVEFNTNGSSLLNLTSNTFNQSTIAPDGRYKSDYASVASNGTTAFASNRGGKGWRIYVMDAVGGHVRQVTFPKGAPKDVAGSFADDTYPVISANGKRIAFVSNRSGYAMSPKQPITDVYVVNANGTGLRQVTKPQLDVPSQHGSSIHGLAWSPDGSQIAFRGQRMAPDENGAVGIRDVLGFVKATGANESDVVVNDCAAGAVLDWSGPSILYSYGGSVQGCPATQYLIRNAASGATASIAPEALGNLPPISPGGARFSPDRKQIVYTLANGNVTELTFISPSGAGRRHVNVGIAPGEWLWWAPGAAIPKPKRLTITPAAIVLRRGGARVQAEATLVDAKGRVISRSAGDWSIDGLNASSPACTTTGLLTASKGAAPQTTLLHATNAGLTGTAKLTVK